VKPVRVRAPVGATAVRAAAPAGRRRVLHPPRPDGFRRPTGRVLRPPAVHRPRLPARPRADPGRPPPDADRLGPRRAGGRAGLLRRLPEPGRPLRGERPPDGRDRVGGPAGGRRARRPLFGPRRRRGLGRGRAVRPAGGGHGRGRPAGPRQPGDSLVPEPERGWAARLRGRPAGAAPARAVADRRVRCLGAPPRCPGRAGGRGQQRGELGRER
jgi:hypothetical protein